MNKIIGFTLVFLGLFLYTHRTPKFVLDKAKEQVTIYSYYPDSKHETKGRGVATDVFSGETFILTAKHVIDYYGPAARMTVVDSEGQGYTPEIVFISECSDLAILSIKGVIPHSSSLGKPRIGEDVYAFDYPKETSFLDTNINWGRVKTGKILKEGKVGGLWEPAILGISANYRGQEGMSGEGVYNSQGELVGIHSSINILNDSVFVPVYDTLMRDMFGHGKCFEDGE